MLEQDPQGNRMLTQALDDEGRFAFTSVQGGEHKICFAASPTNYNTKEFVRCRDLLWPCVFAL